jgi:hypothetical protein
MRQGTLEDILIGLAALMGLVSGSSHTQLVSRR